MATISRFEAVELSAKFRQVFVPKVIPAGAEHYYTHHLNMLDKRLKDGSGTLDTTCRELMRVVKHFLKDFKGTPELRVVQFNHCFGEVYYGIDPAFSLKKVRTRVDADAVIADFKKAVSNCERNGNGPFVLESLPLVGFEPRSVGQLLREQLSQKSLPAA